MMFYVVVKNADSCRKIDCGVVEGGDILYVDGKDDLAQWFSKW